MAAFLDIAVLLRIHNQSLAVSGIFSTKMQVNETAQPTRADVTKKKEFVFFVRTLFH